MYIYKDIVSGDELFTDALAIQEEGGFYVIRGKLTTRTDKVDEKMIGGNASQEEQTESADDATTSGIDLVLNQRLVETGFGSKKDFQVFFKDHLKVLEAKIVERGGEFDKEAFKTEMADSFRAACKDFKEYQFFQGESQHDNGAIALMKWDDEVPVFYFFKKGIRVEKV